MTHSHVLLHLLLIEELPLGTIDRLVTRKPEHIKWPDLYSFSAAEWENIFKLRPQAARIVCKALQDTEKLEKQLALIARHSIEWTTVLDDNYPALLKNIHVPPVILFWQGAALNDADKKIGIVGSRMANAYGQQVIDDMVPHLVGNGWTIVSGGALGADTMAHRATLAAEGKTVVVIGSGLLDPYPVKNIQLFERIVQFGGTVMSQFPVTMESTPFTFPARNRIISGLSRGCVVVQAAEKSGALITARFALEQGREVFAVPGMVTEKLSVGCHAIIQQGAKLVTNVADILVEFGETLPEPVENGEEEVADKPGSKKKKTAINEVIVDEQVYVEPVLSEEEVLERTIIGACKQPKTVDDLLEMTTLPLQKLQSLLFDLQLNGKLMQTITGMWQIYQK